MILIVGLGNPGEGYEDTPHNMGFRVLDFFKEAHFSQEPWKFEYKSQFLKSMLYGKEIILQKPLTFMNNSGIAVRTLMKDYHVEESQALWVAHDELDLSWGRIKIDFARSAAGHKGVESIIQALGTNAFWRFRIGVKPDVLPLSKSDFDRYLTEEAVGEARRAIDAAMQEKTSELLNDALKEGIKKGDFIFTP
ncbi:MAG: aminoacyl-tRNA hydrolase [Candidatus Portnoybacteria bacterium]|nr:aminoacyl-tRNA hydrolase [Candidatus Portnoybacteria bacterium]